MSIDRAKREFHRDSDEEEYSPPNKVHAAENTKQDPMPSTSPHQDQNEVFHGPLPSTSLQQDQNDGFSYQGRGYVRARRERYEMQKKDDSQPKDSPTSRSQPAAIPKILIPATEGFRSPVDVAEALEEELHLQGKLPMRFLHSGQVLLSPPTQDLHDIIVNLRELKGRPIHLQTAQNNTTKGVLLRYPLLMPLSPILKNSLVLAAERFTTRDGEETRQVMITVRGTLPGSLDLGNWGTYYTRPYSKEPLRCFNCQKFGHHRANCTLAAKCGICAGRHDTKKCIQTHKEGGETTAKCPKCDLPHHAWNRKCLARREIVDVQRASQH